MVAAPACASPAPGLRTGSFTRVCSCRTHTLARSCGNTCAHMARPHNAPSHTLPHRPHAAWLPSVAAGASQSIPELEGRSPVSQTPQGRSSADAPAMARTVVPSSWSPSPGLACLRPVPGLPLHPSVRHGGSGQPQRGALGASPKRAVGASPHPADGSAVGSPATTERRAGPHSDPVLCGDAAGPPCPWWGTEAGGGGRDW